MARQGESRRPRRPSKPRAVAEPVRVAGLMAYRLATNEFLITLEQGVRELRLEKSVRTSFYSARAHPAHDWNRCLRTYQ
jgi:hypothetical protein